MSKKVVGATVGTPINPDKFKPSDDEIKKAVDNYLAENPVGGGAITVDSELSERSTNPIQNKAVATAIAGVNVTIGNINALLETI